MIALWVPSNPFQFVREILTIKHVHRVFGTVFGYVRTLYDALERETVVAIFYGLASEKRIQRKQSNRLRTGWRPKSSL